MKPRAILATAYAVFLVYAWPGFVGWDTRSHLLDARRGDFTDSHPPAIAALWRVVEVFVAGPAVMLLIQSVALLVGLYGVLRARLTDRAAAIATAVIFLFPPVAGVTAVVIKDALMAGFLMLAIALMLDRRRLALGFLVAASCMRWNAVAATAAPMLLLFRWRAELAGWRRYAIAAVAWVAVSLGAFALNTALTTHQVHAWYSSHALMDIAGIAANADDLTDADLARILDGVPLHGTDHLAARFRARYNPADYRQLIWGPDRLFELPTDPHEFAPTHDPTNARAPYTEAERAAIRRAWSELVFGHTGAYLRYRWANARRMLGLEGAEQFSNVYVWFHVIAADETAAELDHDANASKLQAWMIAAAIRISRTPLFSPIGYLVATIVLLAFCVRRRIEATLLLSGLGYELPWFFINPTGDFRYSHWMITCFLVALVLRLSRPRE